MMQGYEIITLPENRNIQVFRKGEDTYVVIQ